MKQIIKKLISISIIAAFMTCITKTVFSEVNEYANDQDYTYSIHNNSITIEKYLGNQPFVVIPDSICGLNVTVIGNFAFYGNQTAWSILLPKTVQIIGESAFENTQIRQIVLPYGIEEIGESAFAYSNLTSVFIPSSVIRLGRYAFYECGLLTSVHIDPGIDMIDEAMFFECVSLKDIQMPDTIKEIKGEAFYYCISLDEIELPESIQRIAETAFGLCNQLPSLWPYPESGTYPNLTP